MNITTQAKSEVHKFFNLMKPILIKQININYIWLEMRLVPTLTLRKKRSIFCWPNNELPTLFSFLESYKLLNMHRHFYWRKTWGSMGSYSFLCHTVEDRYHILLHYEANFSKLSDFNPQPPAALKSSVNQ